MYTCTILCDLKKKDADNMLLLFSKEQMSRATLSYAQVTSGIEFKIIAKDAVALRATANTVLKTLAVYEKVLRVK